MIRPGAWCPIQAAVACVGLLTFAGQTKAAAKSPSIPTARVVLRCVPSEHKVASFSWFVARETRCEFSRVVGFAVLKLRESPTARGAVLLRILDHQLKVIRRPGYERLLPSKNFVVLF
jgi:hypothetical protein